MTIVPQKPPPAPAAAKQTSSVVKQAAALVSPSCQCRTHRKSHCQERVTEVWHPYPLRMVRQLHHMTTQRQKHGAKDPENMAKEIKSVFGCMLYPWRMEFYKHILNLCGWRELSFCMDSLLNRTDGLWLWKARRFSCVNIKADVMYNGVCCVCPTQPYCNFQSRLSPWCLLIVSAKWSSSSSCSSAPALDTVCLSSWHR